MEKCTKYTIGKTVVKKEYDESPDASYLGEYTNECGPGIVVRHYGEFWERIPAEMERDDEGKFAGKAAPYIPYHGGEYRCWKPAKHIPHNPANWSHVPKKDKSDVIKKYGSLKNADYHYALQDYARMEDLNNGGWCYIGIIVETRITTDTGLSDVVTSSLWGVESDCEDYRKVVESDLIAENTQQLQDMGFSDDEIEESMNNIEYKDW